MGYSMQAGVRCKGRQLCRCNGEGFQQVPLGKPSAAAPATISPFCTALHEVQFSCPSSLSEPPKTSCPQLTNEILPENTKKKKNRGWGALKENWMVNAPTISPSGCTAPAFCDKKKEIKKGKEKGGQAHPNQNFKRGGFHLQVRV